MNGFKTPLYEKHKALKGNMVLFGGYLLPTHYTSINNEHQVVRSKAGLFDVSHMGEFIISGSDAESFLQSITINDVSHLKVGHAQYTAMCYEDGGIVDDLILYKFEDNRYMMVVNASNIDKDLDFLNKNNKFNAQIIDVSDSFSLIAVQGPNALKVLDPIFDINIGEINYYNFEYVDGIIISNTGYTGCGGFEIYCKNDIAKDLWDKIFESGKKYDIKPTGLAARDTLRLEMGFCLYGNDIDETTSPIEAGLSWITKTNKKFTSSEIFKKQKIEGVRRKLIGFTMEEKAIPRKNYDILNQDNEIIGAVTSGTMSPSLNIGIGLGYVKVEYSKPGMEIFIKIRKNIKKALVVKPPFK